MKKSYISPKARLVNLENTTIMAGSNPLVSDKNIDPDQGAMSKRGNDSDISWFDDDEY